MDTMDDVLPDGLSTAARRFPDVYHRMTAAVDRFLSPGDRVAVKAELQEMGKYLDWGTAGLTIYTLAEIARRAWPIIYAIRVMAGDRLLEEHGITVRTVVGWDRTYGCHTRCTKEERTTVDGKVVRIVYNPESPTRYQYAHEMDLAGRFLRYEPIPMVCRSCGADLEAESRGYCEDCARWVDLIDPDWED